MYIQSLEEEPPLRRLKTLPVLWLILALVALPAIAQAPSEGYQVYHFAQEGVLGTSFDLFVRAQHEETGAALLERVLASIEAQAGVLSSYDPNSEISTINARPFLQDEAIELSEDLSQVLRNSHLLGRFSKGAFNVFVGDLVALWRDAGRDGELPSAESIEALLPALRAGFSVTTRDGVSSLTRKAAGSFQLDGIAKGYILEQALKAALRDVSGVTGILIDIGGDVVAWGKESASSRAGWKVGVADPSSPADNAAPLTSVWLDGATIATSGGYARYHEIAGQRLSHILDPRTGMPANKVASATVVASSAQTADALATALCVLSPEEGLKLIARHSGTECLIVDALGTQHRSPGFSAYEQPPAEIEHGVAGLWPEGFRVEVGFSLVDSTAGQPSTGRRGGRFKRHFVAAWVEDGEGRLVKILAVWAQTGELKYLKDLDTFWHDAWLESGGSSSPSVLSSISRATRAPGHYDLVWDGTDSDGRPVPRGSYAICLDVNREHGPPRGRAGHTFASLKLDCRDTPAEAQAEDQPELTELRAQFGPTSR